MGGERGRGSNVVFGLVGKEGGGGGGKRGVRRGKRGVRRGKERERKGKNQLRARSISFFVTFWEFDLCLFWKLLFSKSFGFWKGVRKGKSKK